MRARRATVSGRVAGSILIPGEPLPKIKPPYRRAIRQRAVEPVELHDAERELRKAGRCAASKVIGGFTVYCVRGKAPHKIPR